MKVTVVGAGAVGATCADNIARKELCDELVLVDIKEGVAEGKAMDLMQTAQIEGFDTKITGSTNDYAKTAGTHVAVITSGIPRKPGMTREELIGINAGIVKGVAQNILQHSPDAIIIVISNPMDTMTYLALKSTGLPKNRIIGMGGALDSARFRYYLSQAMKCSPNDLQASVIGGHGDTTMIPLTRLATYTGLPVSNFLDAEAGELNRLTDGLGCQPDAVIMICKLDNSFLPPQYRQSFAHHAPAACIFLQWSARCRAISHLARWNHKPGWHRCHPIDRRHRPCCGLRLRLRLRFLLLLLLLYCPGLMEIHCYCQSANIDPASVRPVSCCGVTIISREKLVQFVCPGFCHTLQYPPFPRVKPSSDLRNTCPTGSAEHFTNCRDNGYTYS